MSASREKKLRQGAGGYSPKSAKAEQEAAAYQRKARTYTAIGAVVVVLIAALLAWNSGIFQRQKTAITIGGTQYKVNELSYYYHMQSSRYIYGMYGLLDTSVPDDEQIYSESDNKTYRDLFLEEATDALTRVTAFYDKAMEAGYTESQVKDTVDATISDWKANASSNGYGYGAFLKANFGKYMTAGDFKDILTRAAIADAYYAELTDSFEYSDADYQAYYEENADSLDTFEYSQLYFRATYATPVNEDGSEKELTEEEKAELQSAAMANAKEKAEEALAALKEGKDIATLVEEYSPAESADHTTTVGSDIPTAISEELYSYTAGQSGVLEVADTGCYVLVLHDRHLDEAATLDSRHILIRPEISTDTGGDPVPPTEAAWADALKKAESILGEYQAGAQTAESFAALAEKYSEDDGSNTNGGLYEGIAPGNFVAEYDQWLFDDTRKAGDVDIIRHEAGENDSNPYWGYHIVYYVGENDPVWKLTSDSALRSEDVTAASDELTSAYTATLGDGAEYLGK